MQQRCPRCHQRIQRIVEGCPHCHWEFSELLNESPPATDDNNIELVNPEIEMSITAEHIESALDSIEYKDYAAALESLNRAILNANSMDLAQCLGLRGFVNLKLRNFDEAIDDCTESIRQRGEDAETLSWRAAAYGEKNLWNLAFADLIAASQVSREPEEVKRLLTMYAEPALASFRQRVKNGESNSHLFFDRGQVYYTIGNFDNARRDFKLALEEDPHFEPALVGLGEIELALGHFAEAERLASQALSNGTSLRLKALGIRALAIARQGDLKRAKRDIEIMRELCGEAADGFITCAKLHIEIHDYSAAIEDLSLAIQANQFHAQAIRLRGELYAKLHNYEFAGKDFSIYLELVPTDLAIRLARAEVNMHRNRLGPALADFNLVLKQDDINAAAYLGRSEVYLKLKELDQAESDCQKAIRLDSLNPAAHFIRGKILSAAAKQSDEGSSSSLSALAFDRFVQAETSFTRALELKNEHDVVSAEYHYLRGIARYEQQKYFKAMEDFEAATRRRSNHPGSFIWLAVVASRLENWREAIEYLQKAIMLRPSAANQYRKLGKPVAEKSVKHYSKLIAKDNSRAELFAQRGSAHEFLGGYDLAILDYSQSLKLQPDNDETRIRRAALFRLNGDPGTAISELTEVLQRDKKNHAARYQRALAHAQARHIEKATKDIERAIAADPVQGRYWVLRGELLSKSNQFTAAIASFDRAIAIDPTDYNALNLRGNSWLKFGQPLRAISDFSESLAAYPRQPAIVAQRGQAYLRNEQYESANHDFELALTHDQTLVRAYCGRASCLAHQGNCEEGLIWLTKQIQRFPRGRGLSELLMARGKIYYQMSRFPSAINDFTMVIALERKSLLAAAAARCARAVALVQQGQLVKAEKEFRKVLIDVPEHDGAKQAVEWLNNGEGLRPAILTPPQHEVSLTRPPIRYAPIPMERNGEQKESPPFDLWIVRTKDNREYGPVQREILQNWIKDGRIDRDAKLLRSGWPKWRRAIVVYPELIGKKPKLA
ncbi:MAG TPA: tetratricopeptide repeat protein [Pirellulaceae bacterium]|nr:tetratricopeptide repeat protein [Pirellulaceae bacterium]HMO91646.1 tetratricopeptide repeat protein [Pirellulaceae bacterium]HMP68343.1 tetratricopeptide repeat protein [Pirellulaceae bacterium]